MIKTSGRFALILAAGLFLLFGGASQAAPTASTADKSDSASSATETVTPTKHRRHYARHRTSSTAQKSSDDKADKSDARDKDMASAGSDTATPASSVMPPAVANANAQLAAADTPTAVAAIAMTSRANDNVQAAADQTPAAPDNQAVATDQLSDADRALQQDNPPAQKTVVAATDAQPRPAPVMASASSEGSAWDQSSLIGKIFIGFGALLTLASAARMFMA
jgi:hypothetical protein